MDLNILQKITQLHQYILAKKINGILDIIPSYHTLALVYDIPLFLSFNEDANNQLVNFSSQLLNEFDTQISNTQQTNNKLHKIPVCYEKEFALDLENMCKTKQISIEAIIQIHCSKIYDVYSIGFLPGFTYMGVVDESIKIARHDKPRKEVPAGSVGIAGLQTGIYPSNSPGGWQIIGKTPLKIFDPNPNVLAKFNVGDQVQFYPITKNEFETLNEYK
jgi:inhibitor of KinA